MMPFHELRGDLRAKATAPTRRETFNFTAIRLTVAHKNKMGTFHLRHLERSDDNAGDRGGPEVEMPFLRVLAVALALSAASPAAHAEKAVRVPFADCSIHQDAKFYTRFRDLPKEIQRDIVENSGPIAERGEQYHSTDTVIEGDAEFNAIPRRRFVGAAERDSIWVIWYEGMGRRLHVISYWFVVDSAFPSTGPQHNGSLTAPRPCFVTDALLSGSAVEERRSGTAP